MRKHVLLPLLLSLFSGIIFAQDAHYTYFEQAPLYLNPALTGITNSNFRVGGIYRSQWTKVEAPYKNFGVFLDKNNERLSFGLLLNQNKAGNTGFQKTNFLLSLALKKRLGAGNNRLSVGAQIGFNQHRIDYNKLTFDSQYNPDKGYDPALESGELVERSTLLLPDINLGLNWNFSKDIGRPIEGNIGLAFSHLNTPQASYYDENIKYPLKTLLYGTAEIKLSDKLGLEPRILFATQQTARELALGVSANFYFQTDRSFNLGIAKRGSDAIMITAAFKLEHWTLAASYDINRSSLRDVGSGNNAFELGLIYYFGKKKAKAKKKMPEEPLDSDGDGILDEEDLCPEVPGLLDYQGCPEPAKKELPILNDYDKDGITDDNDLCPYEAGLARYQGCNDRDEDSIWDHLDACPLLPGKVENYGCPVKIDGIDSDNDGIPDRVDKCIYIKGLAEFDGCPDTDEDGISDLKDECPYIKGTHERHGCPEVVSDKSISVDLVEFDTDEDIVKKQYYPLLDRVAFHLKNNPKMYLILEGHTDNEGNHLYNYNLSQRRTAAVKHYLMRRGVSMEQLETHFFGETKPREANASNIGKARNRRVELRLFQ